MDRVEDNDYLSFLQSLDDSQFVLHVNSLDPIEGGTQNVNGRIQQETQENEGIAGHSTPLASIIPRTVFSFASTSSDPFNDGLDDVLLGIQQATQEDIKEADNILANDQEKTGGEDLDLESLESSVEQHKFGDYATYFHNKLKKQRRQDAKFVEWDQERRKNMGLDTTRPLQIFDGCIIHVNGHTVPSINEIHKLVILHGGQFLSYLHNKGAATHIICDRLTPRKKIQFKNYKVVKAQWIVDSIAKQELLNWQDYRLIEEVSYGQKRLEFNHGQSEDIIDDDLRDESEDFELPLISQTENDLEDYLFHLEINNFGQEPNAPEQLFNNTNPKIIMDAKHPDFLQHFFANSRLHHLSTWKADLRLRFLRKVIKENKTQKCSAKQLENRIIMHIDFDCFFATASCLNHPELDILKQPIAVSHGGRTSDVASCNYVARQFGVKNGMWVGQAKKLCPDLHLIGYEFEVYEKSSNEFYNYLLSYNSFDSILPVLIDECLVDISSICLNSNRSIVETVDSLCTGIRKDIYNITKCPVSIGVSHNILLAKLALRKAKPNNQFFVFNEVDKFLSEIPVTNLPGIGRQIKQKLANLMKNDELPLIKHLLEFTKTKLVQVFGDKTGVKLYEYARGIENTSVGIDTSNPEQLLGRKSVSVDVNFGIRFDTVEEVDNFFMRLSKELYSRLISLGICGARLTLKLAKRAPNAAVQTTKYLGMGYCEFTSKSANLGVLTNDWGIIGSEIKSLYRMINIPPKELRGISVSMTKLDDVDNVKNVRQMKLPFNQVKEINPFLETKMKESKLPTIPEPRKDAEVTLNPFPAQISVDNGNGETIDLEVFNSLPWDIRREIERELLRRGISLPSKQAHVKGKAFLQQLLPSQLGAVPKYVRVVESPKRSPNKSPSKKQTVKSRALLPIKNRGVYDDSDPFDSSIMNELPSSVRNEVLKDLEYKKKMKKFDLVPLKDKINKKYHDSKPLVNRVTSDWLRSQKKLSEFPLFLNGACSYLSLKKEISMWIMMSLEQKGPHIDDVTVFVEYLRKLSKEHTFSRCLNIIKFLKSSLEYHEAINNCSSKTPHRDFIAEGLRDWNLVYSSTVLPMLREFCLSRNIKLELDYLEDINHLG